MLNKYLIGFALLLLFAFIARAYLVNDSKNKIEKVINENPQYIDVRTISEFEAAHNSNSVNIPLNQLKDASDKIDRNRPIVVVCASGVRSARAKNILEKAGFSNTINGGAWTNIPEK